MKKLLLTLLMALVYPSLFAGLFMPECESCSCKTTSHTTFVLRPVYSYTSPELQSLFHRRFQAKEDGWLGVLQVVPLGGASRKNDRLARYFLPNCSDTLTITENVTENTNVLSEQLGIYTKNGTFASKVHFEPSHHFVGAGFTWQQTLYCNASGNRLWLAASGPYLHIANRIELCEKILDDGGGPLTPVDNRGCSSKSDDTVCCNINNTEPLPVQTSVRSALNQSGWCYGKFNGCTNKKSGLSNLNIVLGLETVNREDAYFSSYIGAVFPSGNRFNAQQVFEPMVGNNDHWGFILGTTCNFDLWYWDCYGINLEYWLDFDIQYFSKRNEIRSFDLKGKPWSRYMQMYSSHAQAQEAFNAEVADPFLALTLGTPGINILTQEVAVKPGFNRSFTTGFVLDWRCLQAHIGYNFFARQAECVEKPECFPKQVAIKSLLGSGRTDTIQQINTNYPQKCTANPFEEYAQGIITANDLDLDSAAHPGVLSHDVFLTLGWDGCFCGYPVLIALGGSYEFSPDNNGMDRWMAWGKFDFSY